MNLKIIILSIILLFIAYYLFRLLWSIAHPKHAVLISTNTKHVKKLFLKVINDYVPDTKKTTFLEIGAGYAKRTRIAAYDYSWKSIVALELKWSVVTFIKLRNIFHKYPIHFLAKDIFKYEISQNSVVYSYMTTSIINKLYEMNKFNGCLVISLSFMINGLTPTAAFKVDGFQKKLYVYDFR